MSSTKRKAATQNMSDSSSTENTPVKKASRKSSTKNTSNKNASSKDKSNNLEELISTFILTKTRPYPLTELLVTFKKDDTKLNITKTLDKLTSKGVLLKKEFGKSVLYLGAKEVSNISEENIVIMREELAVKSNILKEKKNNAKLLRDELNELCKYPTNTDMVKILKEKTTLAKENKNRLNDFSAGNIKISKEDMECLRKELSSFMKIYKARKIVFKNILETLLENAGMKKMELYEEIGLEERDHETISI